MSRRLPPTPTPHRPSPLTLLPKADAGNQERRDRGGGMGAGCRQDGRKGRERGRGGCIRGGRGVCSTLCNQQVDDVMVQQPLPQVFLLCSATYSCFGAFNSQLIFRITLGVRDMTWLGLKSFLGTPTDYADVGFTYTSSHLF